MPIAAEIYYHVFEGADAGEKPPVVTIHGAGGTHLDWPPEIRRLPGFRVYALDLPGHGKSGGRGQQSISSYTQSILDWLDAANLHRAIMIGHSMGSAIALSLALDHPEHILGLGLVGAATHLQVPLDILESAGHPTTYFNAVQLMVSRAFSPSAPPELTELAGQRMAETRPSVFYGDLLASEAFDVSERAAEIQQPTLIIVGEDDIITPLRQAQFLLNSLPASHLEVIPQAGHMVMQEKPLEVAAALVRLLNEITY